MLKTCIFSIPIYLLMQKIFAFLILALLLSGNAKAQVLIDTTPNASQLVKALVGEGITISNITLSGKRGAYGKFKKVLSNLPLDSGILLTTGKALSQGTGGNGVNGMASALASNNNSGRGDGDLDRLVGDTTFDACVLEFDFVPIGDSIKFRYIFSSDEYPQFNCSDYNDVFAFLISGPGYPTQTNIALVPGTTIPVAINSVNSGIAGPGEDIDSCNIMGPGSPFTQYYINNTGGTTIVHNGFTQVFTATAAVQSCQTYHLKLAIADVQDEIYDSGVFLEAGSLNSAAVTLVPQVPVDLQGTPFMAEGCHTGSFKVRLPKKSALPTNVSLQYRGTATYGIDYNSPPTTVIIPPAELEVTVNLNPVIDNLPEGTELIKIYAIADCNNALPVDSIIIELRDYDTLNVVPRLRYLCTPGTPVNLLAGGNYDTYSWSPVTQLNNPGIRNPIARPLLPTTYVVTAQLGTCSARDSAVIRFKGITKLTKKDVFCANASDGSILLGGDRGWAYPLSFSINGGPFQSDSLFANLPVGTYTVRLRDATGCIKDSIVTLIQAYPDLQGSTSTTRANCNGQNGTATVSASGGRPPYRYSVDGSALQPNNNFTLSAGAYSITIEDANGCRITLQTIIARDPDIVAQYTTTAASCSGAADAQITVTATGGNGNYLYVLDNGNYQPSNILFSTSGTHSVNIADGNGCERSFSVFVPINNTVFIDARPDTTICEGDSVKLTTTSNATQFIWAPAGTLSDLAVLSPTAKPPVTTEYFVLASSGICNRFDSVTVTVRPAPIPNAGSDTTICFGGRVSFNGSGGVAFLWQPATLFSNPNIPNPSLTLYNSRQFKLRVTDAFGCHSLFYDSVLVTVRPKIIAFAGRDTTVAINQPLQLQATGSLFYAWMPTTGLNDPNIANPVATLQNDITYTVKVSDDIGCEDSDALRIKTYKGPEIYVPTAFTPNNDGRNDILRPIVIGMKQFDYFRIYNRWGQLVFSSSDYRQGWDGSFKGSPQGMETFTWMARAVAYTGQVIERKGSFVLIR
jgi:gliding motility-associated-like protein